MTSTAIASALTAAIAAKVDVNPAPAAPKRTRKARVAAAAPAAAPSTGLAYDAAAYTVTVTNAVKACGAADRANANAAPLVQAWSLASAAALLQKAHTLDTIKAALIAATPLATRKANVAASGRDISVEALEACGSTIKGHFYSFQRIAKGGDDTLRRLLNGDAFTTVARETKAVQGQERKAAPKGKVTGDTKAGDVKLIPVPSVAVGGLAEGIKAIADRIAAAKVDTLIAADVDAAMAHLLSTMTTARAMIEAASKARASKPRTRKVALAA